MLPMGVKGVHLWGTHVVEVLWVGHIIAASGSATHFARLKLLWTVELTK